MRLIEQLFGLLAPSSCMNCGQEGSLICYWCRDEALSAPISRCYKCNKLTDFGSVCRSCRPKSPLKHVFVAAEYEGAAKELVHKMKFSYSGEAADIIAEELSHTIPALPKATLIVHVPTITNHVRSRGYDHSRRIAAGLSKRTGLYHVTALARHGQHRQVGSKRQQRISGMKGVFRAKSDYLIKGSSILLVDDVLTTGATLEEAARALKLAGAKSVDAVVFASAK